MKNILYEIKQNKYFLLFIFLFGYAQSVQIRFLIRQKINWFIFTPEGAVISFISACLLFAIMRFLIKKWQKSEIFSFSETIKIFGASLFLYLLIINVLSLSIALIFDKFEKNFNQASIISSTTADFMSAFIYGSFFLTYYYYRKNRQDQQKIAVYNQAVSESRINQLKAQLNPHFLFNNLNVLDQLIEEDRTQASDFLNEFAEIYRYVLQAADKQLVELGEELSFAEKYFGLMQYKYGKAYQLEIIQKTKAKGYVAPLTLQLLLENAIQHNFGTENNPVFIKIEITDKLVVSNNIIEKRNPKITSGRALNNLKEQYNLLSDRKIKILNSKELFTVTLPIIQ